MQKSISEHTARQATAAELLQTNSQPRPLLRFPARGRVLETNQHQLPKIQSSCGFPLGDYKGLPGPDFRAQLLLHLCGNTPEPSLSWELITTNVWLLFVYSSAVPQVFVLSRSSPPVPGSTGSSQQWFGRNSPYSRHLASPVPRPLGEISPGSRTSRIFPVSTADDSRPPPVPFPLNAFGLTHALRCLLGHLGQSCGPYIFFRFLWFSTRTVLCLKNKSNKYLKKCFVSVYLFGQQGSIWIGTGHAGCRFAW